MEISMEHPSKHGNIHQNQMKMYSQAERDFTSRSLKIKGYVRHFFCSLIYFAKRKPLKYDEK